MNYNISVKKRGKHMIKEINSVYFIYDGYENELNFETLNLVGGMADAEYIVII